MSTIHQREQGDRLLTSRSEDRRVLLRGAHIVTMDEQGILVGDILIRGNTIERIGADLSDAAGSNVIEVDTSEAIITPGLIDSHVHAWEGQLRGIAPDVDLGEYMVIAHERFAELYRPEDVAIGERITALEAINAGTTTIVDNNHNARTTDHLDAAIGALLDSGIRAVHAVSMPANGTSDAQFAQDLLLTRDRLHSMGAGRITARLFEVAPTRAGWQFAAENGLDVSAEVAMGMPELDAVLASGLLGPGHTLNHCSGLTGDMWRAIADAGAAVNVVPRSDSQYGIGAFTPILESNAVGIQEGISSDNEMSYYHNLYSEMRTLLTIQRGLTFGEEYADRPAPRRYDNLDVLRAATIGGALNANQPNSIGALAAGKRADLVILDMDSIDGLVWGSVSGTVVNASPAQVDAVFIDGEVRKWGGELVNADLAGLRHDAERSRAYLLEAAGFSLEAVRDGLRTS